MGKVEKEGDSNFGKSLLTFRVPGHWNKLAPQDRESSGAESVGAPVRAAHSTEALKALPNLGF